ncbi:MAG TPA: glycosyltransferase [Mycobacteriales bacterium]|nr:glycosyltransferase [Mycobacteriales bacterium]
MTLGPNIIRGPADPRVVIAHDYLTQRGGAERVVLALLRTFPGASVVTSVYHPEGTYPEFQDYDVRVSALQRVPAVVRNPRLAVGVLPRIWRETVIDDADIVIASTTGFAHGVSTKAPKLVYCHNPPRWLYQPDEYLMGHGLPTRIALRALRPYLLHRDRHFAASATRYLANSTVVAERIWHNYEINAEVVHPAAGLDPEGPTTPVPGIEPGFLLTIARPRGYKNAVLVERAVESLPNERLVSVGAIPSEGRAYDPRLVQLMNLDDSQMRWLYANCDALVAASHEDFGLTPVEAASFGKPTVALAADGYFDTVRDGVTGLFFQTPTVEAIRETIERLRETAFSAEKILEHAELFTADRFAEDIRWQVYELLGDPAAANLWRPWSEEIDELRSADAARPRPWPTAIPARPQNVSATEKLIQT